MTTNNKDLISLYADMKQTIKKLHLFRKNEVKNFKIRRTDIKIEEMVKAEPNQTYYLLGVLDDLLRTCWLEVMTGNGAEFGSGPLAKNKEEHPFERL